MSRPRQNPNDWVIVHSNWSGYNLNFIDWTNEWETAMDAMNNDPLEQDIEGILN